MDGHGVGKPEGALGARFYTRLGLSVYDAGVLLFNNHVVWRCPTSRILDLYDRHALGNHLDVGVGTGWYLDRCRFPASNPRIGLVDLNQNALDKAGRRLGRYEVETFHADVLQPVEAATEPFESVSLVYLLHCLPVPAEQKPQVISHLRGLLSPGATVFGATILGDSARHNPMGRLMMNALNRSGVFSNREDSREVLAAGLEDHLEQVELHQEGAVLLFSGRLGAAARN
jgi:SAM-dependent methyltransferase